MTESGFKATGFLKILRHFPDGIFPDKIKQQRNDHNNDVIMGSMASQITSFTIVYSTVYSDADERKHQSSPSLAFEWGIHRGPVNSPHKWAVTRNMFPFDDVIMKIKQQRKDINNDSCSPAFRMITSMADSEAGWNSTQHPSWRGTGSSELWHAS